VPRLFVIVWRIAPLLCSFLRDRRRWIRWGAPVPRTASFHERRARALVHHIATLGPAFVKLAQVFSARTDLVPEPYLTQLARLTDQVPPVPWPELRAALERAWGGAPESIVDELDPVPLAAGSIGQVHRARYQGRAVVVKVLRPGVDVIVLRDARLARAIVAWLYRQWPHHHVRGFAIVLEEFDRHIPEEMDFEREGLQCMRMRERFANEPRLRIPAVETVLTRRDVIVMEYLEGTRIDRLDAEIAAGRVSARMLTETLIETYARMMLRDGVFHADPHPGNLLVDRQNRLVLLDFGMVIDVSVSTRKALFDTILAAINRDPDATAAGFYALGMIATDSTPPEAMRDLVATLLDIAYRDTSMADRAKVLAERVMRELLNWPIVLPGELVYFARTAALIEGVGVRYDSHFNSLRVASPVVMRLRGELLAALLGDDGNREPIVTFAATLGALAGTAASWLQGWTKKLRPAN
jgi:predicted unusual protein kinase regulating ubiquinone biosynthesis (AarF/ABC1/UbiB family)